MIDNVIDATEYMSREGWITTNIPFIFNIEDVQDIQRKVFEFEGSQEPTFIIRLVFKHGDAIELVYPDAETRDKHYRHLINLQRRSKFKVVDGKSGK